MSLHLQQDHTFMKPARASTATRQVRNDSVVLVCVKPGRCFDSAREDGTKTNLRLFYTQSCKEVTGISDNTLMHNIRFVYLLIKNQHAVTIRLFVRLSALLVRVEPNHVPTFLEEDFNGTSDSVLVGGCAVPRY